MAGMPWSRYGGAGRDGRVGEGCGEGRGEVEQGVNGADGWDAVDQGSRGGK